MILETDEQDLRPEILVEGVLGFDDGEVVAGGNDTAIEDDEIVFARSEDNPLLAAGGKQEHEGCSGEGEKGARKIFGHTRQPEAR
jgi:hypothetical protein